MASVNIHHRELPCSPAELGALIDGLGRTAGGMWPDDDPWPAMHLDRPLGPGAVGGHGPIRYEVSGYAPGRWVRFGFTGRPRGFVGFHEFTAAPTTSGAVLTHTLVLRPRGPARLTWPLLWRPLHDAVLETTLDRAEHLVSGEVEVPTRLGARARILIRVLATRPFRDVAAHLWALPSATIDQLTRLAKEGGRRRWRPGAPERPRRRPPDVDRADYP